MIDFERAVVESSWMPELHHIVALVVALAAIFATAHAVLSKKDSAVAIGWVGLIWLVPVIGALGYWVLGINRIRRRASRLKAPPPRPTIVLSTDELSRHVGPDAANLLALAKLTNNVARRPLTAGNAVTPLLSGGRAYAAMLEAIAGAKTSVGVCSYIFDNDAVGLAFVEALSGAQRRGALVRVLVDAAGARYSWPRSILWPLRKAQLRCALFLPTRLPWRMPYANLRNHRKILIVDGRHGFTGGLNISDRCVDAPTAQRSVDDIHFEFNGPIVRHLQESFVEDWLFATREHLGGDAWFPTLQHAGRVFARGISDGPDEDLDKLRWTYLGGINSAYNHVRIVTPYFLPDSVLVAALCAAALRGVGVDIVLPERSNLALIQWASRAMLWEVLEHGCRVWLTPAPFDHSKLMVVDRCWSFVGSGNWDPRSLRLNFEFNVECYDGELGQQLDDSVQGKIESARRLTLEELDRRSLPAKLRDGAVRLLAPYL